MPPSGITGAVFVGGRLLLAGEGERYQIWSVDTKTGKRRLEFETEMCGEAEGLDDIRMLGGELHWLLSADRRLRAHLPAVERAAAPGAQAGQAAALGEAWRLDLRGSARFVVDVIVRRAAGRCAAPA